MNANIIWGIILMGLGSVIGTYLIQKGRTQLAFKSTQKIINFINSTDSKTRTEIINNANLNKNEIVNLVNNQTKESAQEIISASQNHFGIIINEIERKGKEIKKIKTKSEANEEKLKPENIERAEINSILSDISRNPSVAENYFPKISTLKLTQADASTLINACEDLINHEDWNNSNSLRLLINLLVKDRLQLVGNNPKFGNILDKYLKNKIDTDIDYKIYVGLLKYAVNNYLSDQSDENKDYLTKILNISFEDGSKLIAFSSLNIQNPGLHKLLNYFNIEKSHINIKDLYFEYLLQDIKKKLDLN